MKHYGDISTLKGSELEPVNIITFGSPCQDMSVAGKREGLGGNRSSLFYEAIRIIKEMREATNGKYPRYIVWENVPGAFSSNRGEDFKAVLTEICKVKEEQVSVPKPSKWENAGHIMGDSFSVAWRLLDAQHWGVPQRRQRIYLVADFDGWSAGKILFESESLSGYSAKGFQSWQNTACRTAEGFGEAGKADSLMFENHSQDSRYTGPLEVSQTILSTFGTGGNNQPFVVQTPKTLKIRCGCEGGGKGALIQDDLSATLSTNNDQTVFQPRAFGVCSKNSNSMKSDNPNSGFYEADTARCLDGEPAYSIAKRLAGKGIKGQSGVPMDDSTIKNILSSISYTGTMILQKNFFTEGHKRKKNKGELPMYAVEEMFEPLVSEADFEQAQQIMKERAESMPNRNPELTAFSGKVRCANCGCSISRRTSKYGKKWVCNTKERKGKGICDFRDIYETELEDAAAKALNLDGSDADAVRSRVELITIDNAYITFRLKNGTSKRVLREYKKGYSGFSSRLFCGCCGGMLEADN